MGVEYWKRKNDFKINVMVGCQGNVARTQNLHARIVRYFQCPFNVHHVRSRHSTTFCRGRRGVRRGGFDLEGLNVRGSRSFETPAARLARGAATSTVDGRRDVTVAASPDRIAVVQTPFYFHGEASPACRLRIHVGTRRRGLRELSNWRAPLRRLNSASVRLQQQSKRAKRSWGTCHDVETSDCKRVALCFV